MEKFIPNTKERYVVTDTGEIRNNETGKVLHGTCDQHGYLKVRLYVPGLEPKYYYNHRIVAEAFVPMPKKYDADSYELLSVRHINHDKEDNRPENLEWCEFGEAVMAAADAGHYRLGTVGRPGKGVILQDSSGALTEFNSMKEAASWLVTATGRGSTNSYRILLSKYSSSNKKLYGFKIIIK